MKNLISLLILVFLCVSVKSFGQDVHPDLSISHLTGDFYVYTTYNLYKGTSVPANGMYCITDNGVVLIDTPWDTTQFQPLLDSIELKHQKKVVLCIATHSHEDRTAGLEFMRNKGVKTYTSKKTLELCKINNGKLSEFSFSKDTTFRVGNLSFQTFYGGEGHTTDNIVIWFNKDRILYGGCLVKSTEAATLGFIGEANLEQWPVTIKKVQKKFAKPNFVIPGHQGWSTTQALNHTLELLRQHNKKNAADSTGK